MLWTLEVPNHIRKFLPCQSRHSLQYLSTWKIIWTALIHFPAKADHKLMASGNIYISVKAGGSIWKKKTILHPIVVVKNNKIRKRKTKKQEMGKISKKLKVKEILTFKYNELHKLNVPIFKYLIFILSVSFFI